MHIKFFKNLMAWQKPRDLAAATYTLTDSFPGAEIYGLRSHMLMLASGFRRGLVSESQIEVSGVLFKERAYMKAKDTLTGIMKILNTFLKND